MRKPPVSLRIVLAILSMDRSTLRQLSSERLPVLIKEVGITQWSASARPSLGVSGIAST